MLIPRYWAEGRSRQRTKQGQFTARRFGWSDESQTAAQTMADQRAREALERLLAGEQLLRREPKVSYNGAEGVPIREEVISRHGEAVVTRNIYGALCLNNPNVLFADIDFDDDPPVIVFLSVIAICGVAGGWFARAHPGILEGVLFGLVIGITVVLSMRSWIDRVDALLRGSAEQRATRRIAAFIKAQPDWHLRQYRTPAGFRLLAMHRTFSPTEPEVLASFRTLGVDKRYALMCQKQQCFRARVSPKPWRVGISQHIKPRPGTWPVNPARLPDRNRWIEAYEHAAANYSSCQFVAALGSGAVDATAQAIQVLHDKLGRSDRALPIA